MFAVMYISTWRNWIEAFAFFLPPFLLAVLYFRRRHPLILASVGIAMLVITAGGVINDCNNYQSFQRFSRSQGYDLDREISPLIYFTSEEINRCLGLSLLVFGLSSLVTGATWAITKLATRNEPQP